MAATPSTTGWSSGPLPLYFETYDAGASGASLLLVHGGGSTIETNWGLLLPLVSPTRTVIAVELQGHGRTGSGTRTPSFEAAADDLAALLVEREAGAVDVLGFSNGGQVALQLAARHPDLVRRLVLASTPYRRGGMVEGFWGGLMGAAFADLPSSYAEADLAVSHDPGHARRMFDLDRALMLGFRDFPDELVSSITARTLVVGGDRDVVTVQHLTELAARIDGARLLIVPSDHGGYLGELGAAAGDATRLHATVPFLLQFLDAEEES